MPDQTTATVGGKRVNMVIGCGAQLLVFFSLTAVISWASRLSLFDSFFVALATFAVPYFLVFLRSWLYGRKAGGQIVLDCGPHPMKSNLLQVAAGCLLCAGVTGFGLASGPWQVGPWVLGTWVYVVASLAIYVPGAVQLLIQATGRLQVREGGLWLYCKLMRWKDIESYRWAKDSTLWVKPKGPLSFLRQKWERIPREHQQAVDELLRKHCALEPSA